MRFGVSKAEIVKVDHPSRFAAKASWNGPLATVGSNLPMPTPVSGTRFFAQTTAVVAQLREANGDCYETSFTEADTKKNDATQYKAKK